MATSKVEIWNLALTYIGHENYVVSENEQSTERVFCQRLYGPMLGSILTKFDWTFANKRVHLPLIYDASKDYKDGSTTELNPNKIPDYRYMYGYPEDCIKPIYIIPGELFNNQESSGAYQYDAAMPTPLMGRSTRLRVPYAIKLVNQPPFSLQGQNKRVIITDQEFAVLDYTANIEDTSLFTPMFEQMLALMIARPLAAALSKDGKRIAAVNDMANAISVEAEVIDANSETDDQLPAQSEFLSVR